MKKLLFILFLMSLVVRGQELPPVFNFSPGQYGAGNQNWMISQAADKKIYVANNSGLLQFDGEHWNLYEVPGKTAVRSVLATGELIYTGAYMEFGYWKTQKTGRLEYNSLKDSVGSGLLDGEQFWDIKEIDDYIIFQSHQRLYSFNKRSGKITTIVTERNISNLFKVRDRIFYQEAEKGLFVVEDGVGVPLLSKEDVSNRIIIGLFPYSGNKILAVTRDHGLFVVTGNQWEVFPVNDYPLSVSFFSALYLGDNSLALGSIGEGIYLLNFDGGLEYHLLQPTLLNNTVLSLSEDEEGNLWAGLDNGISVVNKESPFRLFVDIFGKIGTVYCAKLFDNYMYLGTNQGLYYKESGSDVSYQLVPGTTGQVWSLNLIRGELYAGHDRGTFKITGSTAELIWDGLGTWTIAPIGEGILQGHYNGLSYLSFADDESSGQYLDNFDLSVQHMVVENDSVVWLSHYHRGVFRLELDENYTHIKNLKQYSIEGDNGLVPQIFRYENEIYFSTEDAVHRYDREKDLFVSENGLNKITLRDNRLSGASIVLPDDSWWTFGIDNLNYVTRDPFEQKLIERKVPLPLESRNIGKGFENISLIGKDEYLVGSNGGYVTFSLPLNNEVFSGDLALQAIRTSSKGEESVFNSLNKVDLDLPSGTNNISFNYSIPNYQDLARPEYSYRLLNYSANWSPWQETGEVEFENLPSGSYTFQVKGRINDHESDILEYKFSIAKPWYLSGLAILIYFMLFLLGMVGIHYFYKRRHKKAILEREKNLKMKNLEAEQKIIRLQKEHLEKDMAEKNGQLAASTMSIVKKNEFLSSLKKELQGTENVKVKSVIKTIDKELSEEDNWEMFQEAFKNADKDFFDKLKSRHPELTSNDLRLCAYLRLNLSSKEIAPLINISVKSVEIKRYRLRKKLNLPRETNLTDYIMQL